jgi:hypothetical protein
MTGTYTANIEHKNKKQGFKYMNTLKIILLQTGRSRVQFLIRLFDFSMHIILPAALWPRGLPRF